MLEHVNTRPTAPERVVVMGSGSFIGGAIIERLERDGVPTLALGRKEVDLLAPEAADRLAGRLRPGDAFVAVSAIAPVKTVPMLMDNVALAHAMVQALAKTPVAHVINISSDAVYADLPEPITESSCASPTTLHGAMHLSREIMFRTEVRAPLAVLRPTLVYGARDPHNGYGPNRFRRLAMEGKDIVLFGKGEERRDHVLVDDVVEIVRRVLLHRSQGVLNVVTGSCTSFRDIAEMVVELSGRDVRIKETPRQGPMPHNGYRPFDNSACLAAFPGFRYTPLAEGLAKVQRQAAEQA
jgi:UDP-glucose 4-epimerase